MKTERKKGKATRKQPEYTGSRWAGLILLIITILLSLTLYLKGQTNLIEKLFGPATYTFTK